MSYVIQRLKLEFDKTWLRAKAFEIAKTEDKDLPWNWPSFLGGFDVTQIKSLFSSIGVDVEVVEDEEER